MLQITFFTSNTTKLAHARYLAEGHQVRFMGFKERTYHASYDEPRSSSRSELLEASFVSALQQGKKARIINPKSFFILEDTSVRMEALSTEHAEVPGLDIKYWMRGRTFADADRMIKESGGDRRVTVRSDVLLYLPDFYRSLWGIEQPYVVFVGTQVGTIASVESKFDTNLFAPWLDNRSFNKWFVPAGANAPLGSLPIAEADKYDFRRDSFGQLFDFLRTKGLLAEPLLQQELALDDRSVLMVSGYTCAGKTTASQHLANHFGYVHVEASDFMYLNYYNRHDVQNDISIGAFAEVALREKPSIAVESIAAYLVDEGMPHAVISGFRSPKEVELMEAWLNRRKVKSKTIFVAAEESIRFDRMRRRKRNGDVLDMSKFQARDAQQQRMGLDDIRARAGTYTLINESSVERYLEEISKASDRAETHAPPLQALMHTVRSKPRLKLEDAILIALLTEWIDSEDRPYFTTTEIAKIIAKEIWKDNHKDNVSRYFNQYFYPYYEITSEDGHRHYRLSNTGYGKALRTLWRAGRSESAIPDA